jgi:hypothetical protein
LLEAVAKSFSETLTRSINLASSLLKISENYFSTVLFFLTSSFSFIEGVFFFLLKIKRKRKNGYLQIYKIKENRKRSRRYKKKKRGKELKVRELFFC